MSEQVKKEWYTVGEISDIAGISQHTLRYYDQIGLLKPQKIDESNGYRYYHFRQLWQIEIIHMCKLICIPNSKIITIMQNHNNNEIYNIISDQYDQTIETLIKMQNKIRDLKWIKNEFYEMNTFSPDSCITLKDIDERNVICLNCNTINETLHIYSQPEVLDIQKELQSIRKKYGHILDIDEFYLGHAKKNYEYVNLYSDHYENMQKCQVVTLPQGKYICMFQLLEESGDSMENLLYFKSCQLQNYLVNNNITPKLIIMEEVGIPFFGFTKMYYEIQILPV